MIRAVPHVEMRLRIMLDPGGGRDSSEWNSKTIMLQLIGLMLGKVRYRARKVITVVVKSERIQSVLSHV